MRVIAGTAKRIVLKTVEGYQTRPTTDRIKETLFNMLHTYLYDCMFLDLYSGSGAIGIEALSRGAKKSVFVEKDKKALEVIKQNLAFTKLSERGELIGNDVLSSLHILERKKEKFDIIFMDPPYNMEYEKEVFHYLESSNLIDENSIIITEASMETDFTYLENGNLKIDKVKEYKTNKHVFVCMK